MLSQVLSSRKTRKNPRSGALNSVIRRAWKLQNQRSKNPEPTHGRFSKLKFLPQNLLPSPGVVPDAISDPSPSVFPRYGHSLSAADTEDGQLLLFGGITKGSATSDLFTFSTQTLEPSVALFQTGGDVPIRTCQACERVLQERSDSMGRRYESKSCYRGQRSIR